MISNEKIFSILNEWNFWDRKIVETKKREGYENKLLKYSKTNKVVILKGVRRCGKSTLLINQIKNLNNKNTLFVNFEDPKLYSYLGLEILDKIVDTYKEFVSEKLDFLFLDEVQNIDNFEIFVRKANELNLFKIFITGSSSKLLSKEFGTKLSGRYLEIEVFPLSFLEFLNFKKIKVDKKNLIINSIKIKKLFKEYLYQGGFPNLFNIEKELFREELINYYNSIILKDIVSRYNLKNFDNIKKVSIFVLSNLSKILNLNNLKSSLNISYELIQNYIEYLKEVYLIFEINKFDYSLKKQFSSQKKFYSIDTGLTNSVSFKFSEDFGRQLENIVFLHFKRQTIYEIFYHKKKFECDFLLKEKDKIVKAVQVTKSLNYENEKREVMGLVEAALEHDLKEGLILTYEDEEKEFVRDKIKIKVRQIWKYLLEN